MSKSSDSTQALFFIRATVLAAILLALIVSLPQLGHRQKRAKNCSPESRQVLSEYKFAKTSTETLERMDSEAKLAIRTWQSFPLLPSADQDALGKLIQKSSMNGAEMTKAEDEEARLKTKHDNLVKGIQRIPLAK